MKHKPFAEQLACFTGEYVGGIIAGVGVGIIIACISLGAERVFAAQLLLICAVFCGVIGGLVARSARMRKHSQRDSDEKHDA